MASSVHVECSRQVLAKFAMSTCHLRAHVLNWMLFSQSPLCARFILVASETYALWQFPHRSPVNLPGYLLACLSIDSVPLFDTANNTHSVLYDRSLTRKPSALESISMACLSATATSSMCSLLCSWPGTVSCQQHKGLLTYQVHTCLSRARQPSLWGPW